MKTKTILFIVGLILMGMIFVSAIEIPKQVEVQGKQYDVISYKIIVPEYVFVNGNYYKTIPAGLPLQEYLFPSI